MIFMVGPGHSYHATPSQLHAKCRTAIKLHTRTAIKLHKRACDVTWTLQWQLRARGAVSMGRREPRAIVPRRGAARSGTARARGPGQQHIKGSRAAGWPQASGTLHDVAVVLLLTSPVPLKRTARLVGLCLHIPVPWMFGPSPGPWVRKSGR